MLNKLIVAGFLILAACNKPVEYTLSSYEDLKGFFKNETLRLNQSKSKVDKTVSRNGLPENRKDFSPDWEVELSLFAESDINKPAWKNSYKVTQSGSGIYYSALDSNLRTRSIHILKNTQGGLSEINIVNRTTNKLYSSFEQLRYIPDSMYRITKKQHVILLGSNNYIISGIFK